MGHEKLYEEAIKVAAEAPDVVSGGPDDVDVKGTPATAEQGADNLFEGVMKARGQRSSNEDPELSFAFYGFASLVSRYMTSGLSVNAESLANEYQRLAKEAGEQLASLDGESPHPNTHLQFLADMMRKVGKPAALGAIDGG
ncbi:MAG TPA: hypothetical protein VJU82_14290 [Acidobacteriaceae bacterium]|nr:hypothetical protein [Acidobacteriaceae bacterium]